MNRDHAIRLAAFAWLTEQTAVYGEVLDRALLARGFYFQGDRIPLVSPQGIFKPQAMEFPLSITTAPYGPYDDSFAPNGLLAYRYRGVDPNHRDNVGLRRAMELQIPLIYFYGEVPGQYHALWPAYIAGDDPPSLSFHVVVDDHASVGSGPAVAESSDARRQYVTTVARRRVHQTLFRERVLKAYRTQCSICRLRHKELLDASHIIPDSDPDGEPVVTNGLSLCKLHHGAFDSLILGVTADYVIQVRDDVLVEKDGPVLLHGLQGFHGSTILLPTSQNDRPNREALERRFERFRMGA